jgi:CDP-diacylglycerol--serine O-phosphatidyltransferase
MREEHLQRRVRLRKTLFVIPSLITLSSLFCGFDAIRIASSATEQGDFYRAALLIIFAMFFDMLDGRVARMTRTQSAFGLQIDSLADIVSFGVAPAVLVYNWSLKSASTVGLIATFLFVAAGAVRLARFNVLSMSDNGKPKKSGNYFVGLPIPGAAGAVVSIVVANHAVAGDPHDPQYMWPLLTLTVGLGLLMISNIRFRSFKDLRFNFPTVLLLVFLVASSALVASQFKPSFVLLWLVGVYVTLGIVESLASLPRKLREPRNSVPPP